MELPTSAAAKASPAMDVLRQLRSFGRFDPFATTPWMTAICAKPTAGVDVDRPFPIGQRTSQLVGERSFVCESMSPASGVLLLGHSGLAEAFQEAFALRQKNRIIALGADTEAVSGEVWIERKPGLGLRPRLSSLP
jgi:hypothetical protein